MDEQSNNLLINSLLNPQCYKHPVEQCSLVETHISWVLLTGEYAYKIKKPVNLGFLDFSTLYKRHRYCEDEVKLNRRLAASLYLGVVPITGTEEFPMMEGEGNAIEYAVKMKQFPQQCQLDEMLAAGELNAHHIDHLSELIADFHQRIPVASAGEIYGEPTEIAKPVQENFYQINSKLKELDTLLDSKTQLEKLIEWSTAALEKNKAQFQLRKQQGFIRECHGDLHLRNLAWIDDKPVAFDCIEFSPELRGIDVVNEIAFLVMDLNDRGKTAFANRLLNGYLEKTGDFHGLQVLDYYLVYRALVRAKVDAIRLGQAGISDLESQESITDFNRYVEYALTVTQPKSPRLIITHGPSGSGKSTLSQLLLEKIGAIRLRSDVERKRIFQDADKQASLSMYSKEATMQTYRRLLELSKSITNAGYPVIVDATFQHHEQRREFQLLAESLNIPFVILDISASNDVLRSRVMARKNDVSDADLQVLQNQLDNWKSLLEEENRFVVNVDADAGFGEYCVREITKMILM